MEALVEFIAYNPIPAAIMLTFVNVNIACAVFTLKTILPILNEVVIK